VLSIVYIRYSQPYFIRLGRRYNEASGKMTKTASEALAGIKIVKVLGCEAFFERDYLRYVGEYCRLAGTNSFLGSVPRQILELIAVSLIIITVVWAVIHGGNAAATISVLALFAAAVYRLMPAMMRITASLQSLRVAHDAIETLHHHFSNVPPVPKLAAADGGAKCLKGEITLKDIRFRYDGAAGPTLDGISLVIRPGEVVGFVGPSGAGKTTLADVILGLYKAESGTLSLDGVVYEDPSLIPRGTFGYVPQDSFLIDDTIRRNIALGVRDSELDENLMRSAMAAAALDAFIQELPQGEHSMVGDRGVRLSGGQRQRIGIARALYEDPGILVLDEATSSIDMMTEAQISDAVNRLRGRKTVIVIAHRLSTVRECDRVFFLEKGRLIDEGSFDDLVRTNSDFAAMVRQMVGTAPLSNQAS
jgi:ATP-binding cassette, subfamily B, bacterial PglK